MLLSRLVLIFTLVTMGSCFKQSAPDVAPDYGSGISDQRRLEACSEVNFNTGFLKHNNIQSLFECTRWDRQFPELFSAIKRVSPEGWNTITAPIGLEFFDDQSRRDRVIVKLKEMDRQGSLDDLGHALSAINETNFYNGLNALFVCATKPTDRLCRDRSISVSLDDIRRVVKLMTLTQEEFESLTALIQEFIRVVEPSQGPFADSIRRFYRADEFRQQRVDFVTALLEKVERDFQTEDLAFLKGLVAFKNGQSFLYHYFTNPDLNNEAFVRFATYFIKEDESFYKDLIVLAQAMASGVKCSPDATNRYVEFDFTQEAVLMNEVLGRGDYQQVVDVLMSRMATLRGAEVFCPEIRQYQASLGNLFAETHQLDFINLLLKSGQYFRHPELFQFSSFLASIVNERLTSPTYMIDMLAGPIAQHVHRSNKMIVNKSPEFYSILFPIVKRVQLDRYQDLERLIKIFERPEMRQGLASLSKVWRFLKDDERNFLFNFLDRHLDQGVDYIGLFDLYAMLLIEFSDAKDTFDDLWLSPTQFEAFVSGLREFSEHFSGAVVLQDFRRFYSREHILEVIRVITNGEVIQEQARRQFDYAFSNDYIGTVNTVRLPSVDTSLASETLRCLTELGSQEVDFYTLIRENPSSCEAYRETDISLQFLWWLGSIQKDLSVTLGVEQSLFDREGMLSPAVMNSLLVVVKNYDDDFEGGVSSLLDIFLDDLLVKKNVYRGVVEGYVLEASQTLKALKVFLSAEQERVRMWRNALVRDWTLAGAEATKAFAIRVNEMLGRWGRSTPASSQFEYNPFYSCHRYLNQNIGYECPRRPEDLYSDINLILDKLLVKHSSGTENALGLLYDAVRAEGGIRIPHNSSNSALYRMTIKETLKMLFQKTDKTRDINRLVIPYESRSGRETRQYMTTMERIEVVIRDVQFGNNYLGVQYMNYVVAGDNYNDDVENRQQTMRNCVRIPVIRCGRKMPDDDKRRANNALAAFDGLLDVNNGRGLDPEFRYGQYMKALLTTIVGSSATEAQKVQLLPLKDEVLVQHNGVLLGAVTRLAGFSHLGRWLHDRFAGDKERFEQFLNSYPMTFVDRTLFRNFPHEETKNKLSEIVSKLKETRRGEKAKIEKIIDWLFARNYQEVRFIEDTGLKLAFIFMHIGPSSLVLNDLDSTYNENSQFDYLDLALLLIDNWRALERSFPLEHELVELFQAINPLVDFIYKGLVDEQTRSEFYLVVNDIASIARHALFESKNGSPFAGDQQLSGLQVLESLLRSEPSLREVYLGISGLNRLVNSYSFDLQGNERGRQWFINVSEKINNILTDDRYDFTALLEYIKHTSRPAKCVSDGPCESNQHYDELFSLLDYLSRERAGQSNLHRGLVELDNNREDLHEFINRVLPGIKIQEELRQ